MRFDRGAHRFGIGSRSVLSHGEGSYRVKGGNAGEPLLLSFGVSCNRQSIAPDSLKRKQRVGVCAYRHELLAHQRHSKRVDALVPATEGLWHDKFTDAAFAQGSENIRMGLCALVRLDSKRRN